MAKAPTPFSPANAHQWPSGLLARRVQGGAEVRAPSPGTEGSRIMFFASMYSYGNDAAAVGVDGIRGCLGIFLITATRLYAIHIPDTPAHFVTGRNAFVAHVNFTEPGFDTNAARLIAVMNGPNRAQAFNELCEYSLALGVTKLITVRVDEFLGVKGLQQDAATIVCELVPGTREPMIKYMRHDDVHWLNAGAARAGSYHVLAPVDDTLSTNLAPFVGWRAADYSNSRIVTFNC
jgi:hypothetical protein